MIKTKLSVVAVLALISSCSTASQSSKHCSELFNEISTKYAANTSVYDYHEFANGSQLWLLEFTDIRHKVALLQSSADTGCNVSEYDY